MVNKNVILYLVAFIGGLLLVVLLGRYSQDLLKLFGMSTYPRLIYYNGETWSKVAEIESTRPKLIIQEDGKTFLATKPSRSVHYDKLYKLKDGTMQNLKGVPSSFKSFVSINNKLCLSLSDEVVCNNLEEWKAQTKLPSDAGSLFKMAAFDNKIYLLSENAIFYSSNNNSSWETIKLSEALRINKKQEFSSLSFNISKDSIYYSVSNVYGLSYEQVYKTALYHYTRSTKTWKKLELPGSLENQSYPIPTFHLEGARDRLWADSKGLWVLDGQKWKEIISGGADQTIHINLISKDKLYASSSNSLIILDLNNFSFNKTPYSKFAIPEAEWAVINANKDKIWLLSALGLFDISDIEIQKTSLVSPPLEEDEFVSDFVYEQDGIWAIVSKLNALRNLYILFFVLPMIFAFPLTFYLMKKERSKISDVRSTLEEVGINTEGKLKELDLLQGINYLISDRPIYLFLGLVGVLLILGQKWILEKMLIYFPDWEMLHSVGPFMLYILIAFWFLVPVFILKILTKQTYQVIGDGQYELSLRKLNYLSKFDSIVTRRVRIETLTYAGKFEEAKTYVEQCFVWKTRSMEDSGIRLRLLGQVFLGLKDYEKAEIAFQAATNLNSVDFMPPLCLAQTLLFSKKAPQEALEQLKQASRRRRSHPVFSISNSHCAPRIPANRAWAYAQAGDFSSAEREIKRAFAKSSSKFRPELAWVNFCAAQIRLCNRDLHAAQEYLRKAEELDPLGYIGSLSKETRSSL